MARHRLVRSLAAVATAGLLSAGAGAQTASLEQIAGRLLNASPQTFEPGDETLGHFELRSAGPGTDVWTQPDRLVIVTSEGRIEARAVAAYASVNIDPLTGTLTFDGSPDFENPLDQGGTPGDNVYQVEIRVSDGEQVDTSLVDVTVLPVNDAPQVVSSEFVLDEETTLVGSVAVCRRSP